MKEPENNSLVIYGKAVRPPSGWPCGLLPHLFQLLPKYCLCRRSFLTILYTNCINHLTNPVSLPLPCLAFLHNLSTYSRILSSTLQRPPPVNVTFIKAGAFYILFIAEYLTGNRVPGMLYKFKNPCLIKCLTVCVRPHISADNFQK